MGWSILIRENQGVFLHSGASWFSCIILIKERRVFDRRGHVAKLCIVFLPLLVAALVGISRVDDYWHQWQYVFAGGLLGLFVSCNSFHPHMMLMVCALLYIA
ncbi:hypothetical protein FEM48_Zijuj10G0136100 [Ziziphus jujuba var. spinosa]|uniref:Phosphatidic acid phosphatase type 2/haloperoxidase domain-containing protein n=1 Tax=Ziziphus jujuba var. spinosa TaxID=714518 RepID=A0A978UNP5_ZIZJJ|nr:hypothetical protein FEM48_Zijuj10G0136100 [Ziziphus jujuba var. spinosa]